MPRSLVPSIALAVGSRPGRPSLLRLAALWLRRIRVRHALAGLDERQLQDVGLDPEVLRREIEKPFWRA